MSNKNRTPNKVTSKWSAIIDGQKTGLAGCVQGCMGCIRGDRALERSSNFGKLINPGPCRHRIGY